jgi:spermidine/putrescine transport system permease protein
VIAPAVPGSPTTRAGIGRTKVPLRGFFIGILLVLYLPVVILFVFSFNSGRQLAFPLQSLTAEWYAAVLDDSALIGAARNSVVVGVAAATAATVIGTMVAIATIRLRFPGRRVLTGLAGLPLIVPFVVMGVAFFLLFVMLDIPRSLVTVAIGHSVIAIPFATLIVLSRLGGIDAALEEAAMDLGATYPATLRRVVLPLIGPSLLSAWLTCFIVSFDEIALAIFLVGGDPTFPVFLYGQLRFAQRLPVLIAMAVVLMLVTVTLTVIALRLRSRDE